MKKKFRITDDNVIRMARDLGYDGRGWSWEHSVYIENYTGWLMFGEVEDTAWVFSRPNCTERDALMFELKYGEYLC